MTVLQTPILKLPGTFVGVTLAIRRILLCPLRLVHHVLHVM